MTELRENSDGAVLNGFSMERKMIKIMVISNCGGHFLRSFQGVYFHNIFKQLHSLELLCLMTTGFFLIRSKTLFEREKPLCTQYC